MAENTGWLTVLKEEFQKSPVASNLVFSLLLMLLEKLVEIEFECPCKDGLNVGFVATFFIIPGILIIVLMTTIPEWTFKQSCCCGRKVVKFAKENARRIFYCIVPAFVWMILLFMDGRYVACGMTKWPGRYVIADKAAPVKWCEPDENTLYEERLMKSQDWYFHSQWAGIFLAGVLVIVARCIFRSAKQQEYQSVGQEDADNPSSHIMAEQNASSSNDDSEV